MSMANPPGLVWQPVAPAKTLKDIIGKKLTVIRAFSIISIVLGILSILLQIATLVIYVKYCSYFFAPYRSAIIGHGIWCGAFYVTAGSLGVAACRTPKTSLLVGTVVMSAISVAGAIVASTLSGITADWGFYHYDYPMCIARLGLEWTLMSISVLAIMNSITLVSLASVPLCCSGRKKGPQGSTKVTIGVGSNQQPMYYQPQPMYVVAQQQPNVQVVHAGQQNPQQIQYPQQQQVQFLPNSQVVYVPQQQQQPQLLQQQYPQQQHTQKAPAAKQQPQAPVVHQQQPQQNQTSPYEELNVQLHAVENTTPTV